MNTIRLAFMVCVFALCSNTHAQQACSCSTSTDIENLLEDRILAQAYIQKLNAPEIQFSTDWRRGDIVLLNGETIHNKYIRYNGFADQLYWLRDKDYLTSIIDRSQLLSFTLHDTVMHTSALYKRAGFIKKTSSEAADIFLEVLAEGEISLYLQHGVKYLSNTNEYFTNNQYYAQVNGQIIKIGLRKRSLVRLLGEKKSVMRGIIRQYDFDLSTQPGMIAAINEYNKLSTQAK